MASGADDRYSLNDPANRYLFDRRERAIVALLNEHHLLPFADARILDVGCGNGGVLADFVRLGAQETRCAGIDLLPDRTHAARARLTDAEIRTGSASALPWPDASFDLALQFTLLSSVLDNGTRSRIAAETLRVLRPGGGLLYYDFIWNPGNSDTRGLRLGDLRALYSGCEIDARRTTLAPPITRALARWSMTVCRALEALSLLRSHYLALITKP
jgi:ubiquinone/menaquinone biosynthesis C-methylase UbiE